jgi:tellurite resistance protein
MMVCAMTDELEQRALLQYLSATIKKLYREQKVFQMVSEWLRTGGDQQFDNLVADARKSTEFAAAVTLFESVIDAKIPPSSEESEDQALAELIQWLGLDQGMIH